MEDLGATLHWMYTSSGLEGLASSVSEWLGGIDWTPVIVLVGVVLACYMVYVLLDESL